MDCTCLYYEYGRVIKQATSASNVTKPTPQGFFISTLLNTCLYKSTAIIYYIVHYICNIIYSAMLLHIHASNRPNRRSFRWLSK